jgi:hypothetical protein
MGAFNFGFKSRKKLFILRREKDNSPRLSYYNLPILHNAAIGTGLVQVDRGLYEDQIGTRYYIDYDDSDGAKEKEFNEFYK